jgi:hypothetical protein
LSPSVSGKKQGWRSRLAANYNQAVSERPSGTSTDAPMPSPRPDAIFPLPLAAFEEYMFSDDRPDAPADCFYRLQFDGVLHRAEFEAALAVALKQHPLLRAKVERAPRGGWQWVEAGGAATCVHWHDGPEPLCDLAERVDLTQSPGLRVYARAGNGRSELLLQAHHATCDGLGAITFLEDLFAAYHDQVLPGVPRPAARPRDVQRLPDRNRFALKWWQRLVRLPMEVVGAFGAMVFLVQRPAPLESAPAGDGLRETAAADAPPAPLPLRILSRTFNTGETCALKTAARHVSGTLNDLLVCQLYHALFAWQRRHDPQRVGRAVRIMVPMSLRTMADAALPAANSVAMVFLDRRPRWLWKTWPKLFERVLRWELQFDRRWRMGMTMIRLLRFYRRWLGLNRLLPRHRAVATTVLTNIGNLIGLAATRRHGRYTAGNVTLTGIEGVPPVRPHTNATFAAASYANRLTISMRYDPRRLSAADAGDLLDTFVAQLLAVADAAHPPEQRMTRRSTADVPPPHIAPVFDAAHAPQPHCAEVGRTLQPDAGNPSFPL